MCERSAIFVGLMFTPLAHNLYNVVLTSFLLYGEGYPTQHAETMGILRRHRRRPR